MSQALEDLVGADRQIETEVDIIIELADLVLQLGRVERQTYHPDGIRPETDTDHTVMLGVIGCAFAAKHRPDLDIGEVAQLIMIHDLVEAIVGDTPTLKLDPEGFEAKQERERQALIFIKARYGPFFSWIHQTIEAYEALITPESRYVKMMDKLMPSLTHILNHGAVFREQGISRDHIEVDSAARTIKYASTFGRDQPEIMALREQLRPMLLENCF